MPVWLPFFDFCSNIVAKMDVRKSGRLSLFVPRGHPKTLQKHIRDATSIFHRFWSPFWWYFEGFGFQNQAIGTPRPHQNVPKTHPQRNFYFLSVLGSISVILFNSFGLPAYYSPPMSRKPADFSLPISLLQVAGVLGCGGVALRLQLNFNGFGEAFWWYFDGVGMSFTSFG